VARSEESSSPLLAGIVTFVVVAAAVYIAGIAAAFVLRHIILPLAALVIGFLAGRTAYRASKGKSLT
jgi:divalent metal cation (Fe/Co/Zn/Cd) transporter